MNKTYYVLCAHFLFVYFLTGCGTLGGSEQIISIDSEQRGEAVYDKDGVLLEHTPFFIKINPKSNLLFKTISKQGSLVHKYQCSLEWWRAPLENIPLALLFVPSLYLFPSIKIGSAAFATVIGGMGIDILSGAAFECPYHITLPSSSQSKTIASKCGIQVPQSLNDDERKLLINTWMESTIGKSLCDSLIPLNLMRSELRILGLSNHIDRIKRSDQEVIFRFGYRTHSNRLIFLSRLKLSHFKKKTKANRTGSYQKDSLQALFQNRRKENTQNQSTIKLRYKVLDLHTLRLTKRSTMRLKVDAKLKQAFDHSNFSTWLRRWFYLFPDAIHIGRSSLQLFGKEERGRVQGSSFSITRISHPDAFAKWDFEISFAPEIMTDLFISKLDLGVLRKNNMPKNIYFRRWGGGLVSSIITHTPMGAFGVGFIAGGFLFSTADHNDSSFIYGLQGSYTGFIDKHFFVRLEGIYYHLDLNIKQIYINSGLSILLAVGVHIPEAASWMRSLF